MLSKKQVKHVAELARLSLSQKEVKKFQKELAETLDYIEVLEELDTEEVEPTSQVTGLCNVFRKDEKGPPLPRKKSLSGADQVFKGYFKIPPMFE